MSYLCNGKAGSGCPCKNIVKNRGDYCRFHLKDKIEEPPCQCNLPNGHQCPYSDSGNGFCEYHQEHNFCQGNTIVGGTCMAVISEGNYCWYCNSQDTGIYDEIKTKANEFREFYVKIGNPIVSSKKISSVNLKQNIVIPDDLKPVNLNKPEDCCICLESMSEKCRKLSCGHFFHDNCLSEIKKMECPLCRKEIVAYDLPKWMRLRIKDSIKEEEAERQNENMRMAMEYAHRNINDLLDVDSSEEESLLQHVQNGETFRMEMVPDQNGVYRYAMVLTE